MAHERLLRTQPLSPVPTQAAPMGQTQRMQAASAPNPTPMPSASPVPNTQPIPRPAPRLEARPASPEQRSRSLFRERALLAHSSGEAAAEPLRIAPIWTRWTILSGALLVVGALLTAFFVRVELVATGRGILQAAGPPRIVAAQVAGRVVAVAVGAGDRVREGQELLRVESLTTEAGLVEANRATSLAEAALADLTERKAPLYTRRKQALVARANALGQRTSSGRATVARMARRAARFDALGRDGLTTSLDVDEAKEAISTATREALRSEEEGAQILDQIAALDLDRLSEETRLKEDLAKAKARLDAVQLSLQASVVRAPSDGIMGALPLRIGDAVSVGATIGRIVPLGVPHTAVAYVPERDRAFLQRGGRVRVEVDQLPIWEFGALQGRITSIGNELATSADLQATFGERSPSSEPLYRVDVALDAQSASFRKLSARLRPESLASLRFNLRRRRLITVFFEPLRRWLE